MSDTSNHRDGSVPEPLTEAPNQAEVSHLLSGIDAHRFADKLVEDKPEVDDEEEEDDIYEPQQLRTPKDPNVAWLPYPSIPDQLQKMPHTVRTGPQIEAVFNLSNPGELTAYNLIQGQATDQVNGQTAVIHQVTKEFHQGSFYALVTYAKLFYQQI